ncbi:glycosyltransferase family 2 protein [Priestia flexa]|uniref:glycosyltransferase family 2 protein n=1 Tax=Priestia flexa TaxID=86664 RepID=UPI003FD301F7
MNISVCMAIYNGSSFLKEQLDSILIQLTDKDEVIIVNDNSSDNSLNIISQYNDSRIKVFSNNNNIGVIKSFELAISKAIGDIIFLSDQDDVWVDEKVETIKATFIANPKTSLVISDAYVTNGNLEIEHPSFYKLRNSGKGLFKNFYKNTYLGCAMAFKKELKAVILPIPDSAPMHDIWIGLLAEIFTEPEFISSKLILYRRHGNNVTSLQRKASLSQVVLARLHLFKLLMQRVMKVRK